MSTSQTLVIIPTYNAEAFLGRSITSFLNQTKETELWIVDNVSSDRTIEIVEDFQSRCSRIKLIKADQHLDRLGSWNRCLDLFESSSFGFLKFLFMGDELLPDCIETLDAIHASHPDVVDVVWPYIFSDLKGNKTISDSQFKESRRYTKTDLVKLGYFPSEFLGAIIAVALSKKAVQNNRFNNLMLGIVPFYDELLIRGDSYVHSKPLSQFNLDSHRSFASADSYHIVLESSFAKARSLERNKNWISASDYSKIKNNIASKTVLHLLPHYSTAFWLKLAALIFVKLPFVWAKKGRKLVSRSS
jgi:glycosyltransferase involved in cell wall biosynthesis